MNYNKKIFVCSPYRGDIENNIKNAIKACKFVLGAGNYPYCPHLYFTRFLDDDNELERNRGIECGLKWLELCDEVWVFGDTITEGMTKEIKYAESINKPVIIVKAFWL